MRMVMAGLKHLIGGLCFRHFWCHLLLGVCLTGCAAPGQPPMDSRSAKSLDALPDCKNVSPNARIAAFVTQFYLTTWGSAAREGAILGVRKGLAEGGGVGLIALARMERPDRIKGSPAIWRSNPPEPFCMRIAAPRDRVDRALQSSFAELRAYGYRASRSGGISTTGFVRRSHKAAAWMDRFAGYTYALPDGGTAVVVRRDVLISRQGNPFVQADSVGQLETWIMTRTRQKSLQ